MGIFRQLFIPNPIQAVPAMPKINTVMTNANIANIRLGNYASIPVKKLILKNGEQCFFCDYAVQITEKLCTTARHGNGYGVSFRICKGLTWHTGTRDTQQIRDKVPEYIMGKLYITDKRVVFSAESKAFNKYLKDLISYRIEDECIILQFSNASYKLYLPIPDCAELTLEHLL